MPKYLLLFAKTESVRWLGHLDILRAFERAVRRADLPIAFTLGFNPRERLTFASALSTGITGAAEPAVLELTEALPPAEIFTRLNGALPPGIRIQDCTSIPDAGMRDLLNSYDRAEYTAVCALRAETDLAQLEQAIAALLAQTTLPITREREGRTKVVDIRPFVYLLEPVSPSIVDQRLTLRMIVGIGEGNNVKPGEVVAALSHHVEGLTLRRAHRVCLFSKNTGAMACENAA